MPRYQRVENIVQLALALRASRRGLCLEDIQERFGVGRRTAERMRETVARLFPQLSAVKADDGRKYWRLPPGTAEALLQCSESELATLEGAVERAAHEGRRQDQRHLQSVLDKVRVAAAAGGRAPSPSPAPRAEPRPNHHEPPMDVRSASLEGWVAE
jgi:predicted DNA-binding transcriptional regulator YafY